MRIIVVPLYESKVVNILHEPLSCVNQNSPLRWVKWQSVLVIKRHRARHVIASENPGHWNQTTSIAHA